MTKDYFYLACAYLTGLMAVIGATSEHYLAAVIAGILCAYCYHKVRFSYFDDLRD